MRHGKLIAGLVLGLVVFVTLGSLTAYRLVRRAFGNAHSASGATQGMASTKGATLLPVASPLLSPPIIVRGAIMAQAFRSGRLPRRCLSPKVPPKRQLRNWRDA
jgi:hypothetical protein